MASEELFTREEVLGGMPAQRARTLLFLIESRTAQLVADSRRAMLWDQTSRTAEQQDLDFLEAFAAGKDPPLRPTIQDLERFAPQWASLVPDNPGLRASLAKLFGEKYLLVKEQIPNLRQAVGLDDLATQRAFQRQQRIPLETIYAPRPGLVERARWLQSALAQRFENLSPFWTAFSLTLTETVGVGILALPIAVAGIGPIPAVFLILVMGLVNLFTIAYLAEAVARSGEIRYGKAYFGGLVTDLLGRHGSLILRLCLVMIYALALLAFFIGLSTTLADTIGLPAIAWTGLIFLVNIYFLRKESLNATISAALLVGFVNIGLILSICLLTLPAVNSEMLSTVHLPLLQGEPFDPAILALVFGTILLAFFGHTSLGNCARVVLQRDPSGRSFIWGSLVAQIAAVALYCLWVLVVNGAIEPAVLAAETGTALIPLTAQLGPLVGLLGSIFVILAMGMGSIHYSLGFYNLMREWLPRQTPPEIVLSRAQGRVILTESQPEPVLRIGISYRGQDAGLAQLSLDIQSQGTLTCHEIVLSKKFDCWQLFKSIPGWQAKGYRLVLELVRADVESARLIIDTNLNLTYEENWQPAGLAMADLLELPADQRQLVEAILRRGEASLAELASQTRFSEPFLERNLESLALQGFLRPVETEQGRLYRVQLAARRAAQLPEHLWQTLAPAPEAQTELARSFVNRTIDRLKEILQSDLSQFMLGASPIAAIFLFTVWLLVTGQESFTRPISFLGLIVVSLLGGAFPVLLLIASRRKGELIPQVVYPFLGNPLLLGSIYFISIGGLFLHGLVIWQNPFERSVALLTGIFMLAMTLVMVRRGVFQPRAVVELLHRTKQPEQATLTVNIAAQPAPAKLRLGYPQGISSQSSGKTTLENLSSLEFIDIQLPELPYKDLKVWAHEVTPHGSSYSLPVQLEVQQGEAVERYDLTLSSGQHLLVGEPHGSQKFRHLRLLLTDQALILGKKG